MSKISDKIVIFITTTIENWRVESIAGVQMQAEVKILRRIFQEESLSPQTFLIAMMPLRQILRKFTVGNTFFKSKKNIIHLTYMDGIKLFSKNEKDLETLIQTIQIYRLNIGMEFGIEKCGMLIMKSGNRKIMEGTELPNQERNRKLGGKDNFKNSRILEADTIKQVEGKEKKKVYLRRTRELLVTKLCSRNLIKEINNRAVPFCKILWTILEMDKGGT